MLELASRTLARPSRATLPGSQAPRPWPALADERTKNGSTPDPPPPPSLHYIPLNSLTFAGWAVVGTQKVRGGRACAKMAQGD